MVEGLGLSDLRETDWESGETEESGTSGRTRWLLKGGGSGEADGRFLRERANPEPRDSLPSPPPTPLHPFTSSLVVSPPPSFSFPLNSANPELEASDGCIVVLRGTS